jgi:hypothetical protein
MLNNIPYTIGNKYKYNNDCADILILKSVKNFIFHFRCGHFCTDNIFVDLIDLKDNIQVF